ncbi:putative HVA22-like protein g isoform X2 [Phalaenopsis equestris]|uniref:putative HVA22-like protein g isoform X2 n=1 Tax=Phalaenopsis equestris TaxID=78828 RepID=UPI0009E48821|nr:putative HVA22-like protein g isoform X2 [Phalaenopsis equestris]
MIGSFLTRALALVLGYAYPAYECFKTVELNRPEIEQLRFWCQYWILVAALTVFERAGDTFISWMPMYSEAKVAFFVYLWYPKTKGTTYIYETFLRPYVTRHETEIDRNLLELKARAGDMVFLYWQKAAMYGQTRIFQIFQFISFQPTQQQGRSRPTVRHSVHLGHQTVPSVSAGNQVAPSQKPLQPPRASPSPTKNKNHEPPAKASGVPPPVPTPQIQLSPGTPYQPFASANTSQTSTSEGELKQIATTAAEPASVEDSNLPAKETPIEEAIRMTRGRLRKRAGSFGPSSCQ